MFMVLENKVELGINGMLVILVHGGVVGKVGSMGDGAKKRPIESSTVSSFEFLEDSKTRLVILAMVESCSWVAISFMFPSHAS